SIRLNIVFIIDDPKTASAQRADDSHRHRLPDAKWVAHCQHHVTHLHVVAVRHGDGAQIGRSHFEQGNIGFGIRATILAVVSPRPSGRPTLTSSAPSITW